MTKYLKVVYPQGHYCRERKLHEGETELYADVVQGLGEKLTEPFLDPVIYRHHLGYIRNHADAALESVYGKGSLQAKPYAAFSDSTILRQYLDKYQAYGAAMPVEMPVDIAKEHLKEKVKLASPMLADSSAGIIYHHEGENISHRFISEINKAYLYDEVLQNTK